MRCVVVALFLTACAPLGSPTPTVTPSVAATSSASPSSNTVASPSAGTVAVDRCGVIDEAFLSDPPSGGNVTISGVKFLVQGADPNRNVTLSGRLVPGANACARGTGIHVLPGVIDMRSGSVTGAP